MASATAYLRVHENQHWLSDAVAGTALGIATGRFSTHRSHPRASSSLLCRFRCETWDKR